MKKFLATLLALALLLSLSASALATDTVSYYLRGGSAEYEPYLYEELGGLLKIQELADVDIDWTVVCGNGDEIKAQYLAKMSSGNYPDVIQWLNNEMYVGGVSQMYNDGIIIPLNDMIDQYMPKYKAFLEANPDVANALKNDDGQYLYFTAINPLVTAEDRMAVTWWGLMLRQDWLDNVGAEVPTTIDEWYEVLTAFKEMDPNGNGEADEIPYDAASAGLNLFMPAFNIMNGVYIDPETGKVGYGEYSKNYKAYLETMSKWYAEGLIKDVFADETGAPVGSDVGDQNIYADLSGSMKALSNYWEQRLPQLLQKNPNADFVPAPWPVSTIDGKTQYGDYGNMSYIDRTTTCVSTDCKNIEAVARLMEVMLSEEGCTLLTWGVETDENGENGSYSVDENGNKYINEWSRTNEKFYDGMFPRQFRYAMSHICFPRIGGMDYTAATREPQFIASSALWSECDTSLAYPACIVLSTDEQKAATAAIEDIGTYISEMFVKFITGQEPLTNYDNYIDTLQKMGMDDLIAAYQAAYDRYLAR